ncbi:MAG: aspartate aminotransferase family protein [Streptosporangiales bacterium]|nr:aspartate aminotransferase family protein [Streptosporangiales bacterium]
MSPEEFRRHGYALVDRIADYWTKIGGLPVGHAVAPGEVAAALPADAPESGEAMETILADIDRVVMPGIVHWQHPRFFGYFPSSTSPPSVLADLLCAGLGVQGMLWATSPACTELETVTLDWLARLLGLPEEFTSGSTGGGVIMDAASSATLVAVVAALHRADPGWRDHGVRGRYAVYASAEAHSAINKAVRIAGLGEDAVRSIRTDPRTLAMDAHDLAGRIAADRDAGVVPLMVLVTVGTTSTTAVDPLPAIGPIAAEAGAWLHVDAAYAGVAAVCPEFGWVHDGLEYADSYCTNPHKWLLVGFDCDTFFVRDRLALTGALGVLPEYLRNAATESGDVIDYRDWQIPLGRRFRALKLWFVLRWYGSEGLRAHVRNTVAMAQELASRIAADDRFVIVAPHPFGLVCFRPAALPGEADTAADARAALLLERANASGTMHLTHTKVHGRYTLRLAIGNAATTPDDVAIAWERLTALV